MSAMDWATLAVALLLYIMAHAAMYSVLKNAMEDKNKEPSNIKQKSACFFTAIFWPVIIVYILLVRLFFWSLNP